jgi:hypothetical protein
MRQENFLIALFNKELLDLRVRGWPTEEGKGRTLTRALEWNLQFCLMEYLFDRRGRVRKVFLKSKNRAALIEGCVIRKDHATVVIDVGPQFKKTFHFHGYFERHFRTVHRGILAYVFVLPIFRSTYLFSRHLRSLTAMRTGIIQESLFNQRSRIYSLCAVEVPGIQ